MIVMRMSPTMMDSNFREAVIFIMLHIFNHSCSRMWRRRHMFLWLSAAFVLVSGAVLAMSCLDGIRGEAEHVRRAAGYPESWRGR